MNALRDKNQDSNPRRGSQTSRSLDRDACNGEAGRDLREPREPIRVSRAERRTRKSPIQNGRQKGSFPEAGSGGVAGGGWGGNRTDAKRGEIIKIGTKRGILTGCLPARPFLPFVTVTRAGARERGNLCTPARMFASREHRVAESENQTTARHRYAESRIKAGTL